MPAFRTYTFYNIFCLAHLISFRYLNLRNLDILKAEGMMTHNTCQMHVSMMMPIATLVMMMTLAQAVLLYACTIIDGVKNLFLGKERQSTEYR